MQLKHRILIQMRFVATQTCPEFWKAPMTTSGAVFLMSTSGRMIEASLPPSSRVTRLRVFADVSMTFLPVAIEPVNEILAISGWWHIAAPSSLLPPTT